MSLPVKIVDYDPKWPQLFEDEKTLILKATGHMVVRVEHIGSTAVRGLGAKPIIDILAAVNRLSNATNCIEPLRLIGYRYCPEHEAQLPERRYFQKGDPSKAQHYHLHVVELMSDVWTRHLAFRDYLRAHSDAAHEYQQLKQRLAKEHGRNREAYTEAKTPFIESVLAKARAERIHAGQ